MALVLEEVVVLEAVVWAVPVAVPLWSRQSVVWRLVALMVRGWALVCHCAGGMRVLGGLWYGCHGGESLVMLVMAVGVAEHCLGASGI